MIDRFKFRVWDNIGKRHIYDDFSIHAQGEFFNLSCICSDDIVIEQCTGLKDKNGTLIFEGDVLKVTWENGSQNTHRKEVLSGVVSLKEYNLMFCTGIEDFDLIQLEEAEIIGNIHTKETK